MATLSGLIPGYLRPYSYVTSNGDCGWVQVLYIARGTTVELLIMHWALSTLWLHSLLRNACYVHAKF
jgi:hypothetical protein